MKKMKAEKICKRILLFFLLQIGFMFILKFTTTTTTTTTTTNHLHHYQLQEQKAWTISTKVTRSISSPNSRLSIHDDASKASYKISLTSTRHLASNPNPIDPTIFCNRSHRLYDWCHMKNPTILEPKATTFFTRPSTNPSADPPTVEKIRPYPRKTDNKTMSNIREITLTTKSSHSQCTIIHDTPALVFSIGGFTGNFFHDFNDGFVPLFITINTLFPNQDVTLVITNYTIWWYGKYEAILPQFSKHPIINLDNQTVTHCFPSVGVGLITHGPMTINPSLISNRKNFLDFRALFEEGYRRCPVWPPPKIKGKPRLVLVSRAGPVGRVILNQDNVIKTAQQEGFDVVIFEPSAYTYLCDVYRLINGSHAIMGVHGAALTHSLFLQPGASFIQVVPLGGDWLAKTYFRNLANGMELEYMEYKIKAEESSLVEKYGKNHILIRDPYYIASKNWTALNSIYLRSQDVRLNITKFRGYLKDAYTKAKKLMENQGLHVKRRPKIKKFIRPPVFSYTYGVG